MGAADRRAMAIVGLIGALGVFWLLVRFVRRARSGSALDWQEAERWSAAWLSRQGCRNVALTVAGADGGIDVLSRDWAVQVKHTARPVGRPAVQQIVGAALDADRRPAVISTSGFSAPALDYADAHEVALLVLETETVIRPVNRWALEIGGTRRRRLLRRSR
ncbi:MAG: restriction endonuclease [Actinomycetota bacterium]